MALSTEVPPPLIVNDAVPTRITATMKTLSQLPIIQPPITMRPHRSFLGGITRIQNEEAWLATERGTIPEKACARCIKGIGPFTTCVVVEGFFGESCTNCHYGKCGYKCSFRLDAINAEAQLEANVIPAPEIPGMAPARNTGGTLESEGVFFVASARLASSASPTALPKYGFKKPTPGIARGGRGVRRIAPTPVDRVTGKAIGYGPYGFTVESARAYAKGLTDEQRRGELVRLKREMEAVMEVQALLDGKNGKEKEKDGDDSGFSPSSSLKRKFVEE